MTPDALARELGLTGLKVRAYLREAFPEQAPGRGGRWSLTRVHIRAVRTHFGAGVQVSRLVPAGRTTNRQRASTRSDGAALASAQKSLRGPGVEIERAQVASAPGLYAIHADASGWHELGLGDPLDGRPLYVGKAEDSLVARDIATHFSNGRTGSSTLRRSLAALLRERLTLRGMPRNPEKPGYYASFGLSARHDARLTGWMLSNLKIATWPAPPGTRLPAIEGAILRACLPPLNLQGVTTPWSGMLSGARAVMAAQAREWKPGT